MFLLGFAKPHKMTGETKTLISEKEVIRRKIWRTIEESGVARFPRPVYGRIPNFVGAEEAARRLVQQVEFQAAEAVKVNPDAPQSSVRTEVLSAGKLLVMPTPRLRRGFIILDPKTVPERSYGVASSIKGSFRYGRFCSLTELPKIDLIVAGSVAVSKDGVRIGKGGGYSEMEYGILRELRLAEENTPIFTMVHDSQIVDSAPREPHDFKVDAIITPTRVIRVERKDPQPKGIFWEKISPNQLRDMPLLLELKGILENKKKSHCPAEGAS